MELSDGGATVSSPGGALAATRRMRVSLSGAMTPAEAMPNWLRPWTAVNPVYHFGVISRAALIKGSGFVDLWPHLLALLGFALVLVSISVWRFRKQLT